MSKITKSEKWFGKKKKDLTPEELKEFWRLDAQERRSNPEYREYHKQYNKQYNAQYRKDNKEKINQSIKDWKQNNPDKVKGYRYAKLNREIEYLKKQLKITTDLMQSCMQKCLITEKALELACETIKQMCGRPLWIGGNIPSPEPKDSEYFKDIAKEMLENE